MSKPNLDLLKKIAPGFKEDRDDDWVYYLSKESSIKLRRWRVKLMQMLENLDDLKLDPASNAEEKALTQEINTFIKGTLLIQLPLLKDEAIKKRDGAITEDFSSSNKRIRLDEQQSRLPEAGVVEYLPFDFLPSAMTRTMQPSLRPHSKSTGTNPSKLKQKKSTKSAKKTQQKPVEPARDTYYDGVTEESFRRILKELRPSIERYECKNRVIETLESYKRSMDTIQVINYLGSL